MNQLLPLLINYVDQSATVETGKHDQRSTLNVLKIKSGRRVKTTYSYGNNNKTLDMLPIMLVQTMLLTNNVRCHDMARILVKRMC